MRTRPYVDVSRVKCAHCRTRQATDSWSVTVCANARRRVEVAVCAECDAAFNDATLAFINHPDRARLMTAYRKARGI